MHVETFSYLPRMSDEQVTSQVKYVLDNNWIPGVEYTTSLDSYNSFWSFWKLPLFEAKKPQDVLDELNACKEANPNAYVRVTGYDNVKQGQVLSFVVHRPE